MPGDLEINASASAWTTRDHTGEVQLRQKTFCFWLTVFEHPLGELIFCVRERALIRNWFYLHIHDDFEPEIVSPNAYLSTVSFRTKSQSPLASIWTLPTPCRATTMLAGYQSGIIGTSRLTAS